MGVDKSEKLLTLIADILEDVRSGRDEMSAEDAFQDAVKVIAFAIREAIAKVKKTSEE